jgi:hypothetical protein
MVCAVLFLGPVVVQASPRNALVQWRPAANPPTTDPVAGFGFYYCEDAAVDCPLNDRTDPAWLALGDLALTSCVTDPCEEQVVLDFPPATTVTRTWVLTTKLLSGAESVLSGPVEKTVVQPDNPLLPPEFLDMLVLDFTREIVVADLTITRQGRLRGRLPRNGLRLARGTPVQFIVAVDKRRRGRKRDVH